MRRDILKLGLRVFNKILLATLTLVIVVTLMFVLVRLAPGDPIAYRYRGTTPPPRVLQELRAEAGLGGSLSEQYFSNLGNLLRGELGDSISYSRPVLDVILARLPPTLLLMLSSLLLGTVLGTILGSVSARKAGSWSDTGIRIFTVVLYSTPGFWLGIVLVQVFALHLGILPTAGMVEPGLVRGSREFYLSVAQHSILPIATLSSYFLALFARYSRTSLLRESVENYVLTARAKGLSAKSVFRRHILRNGLLPVITLTGISFRYLFGGTVLVEAVFSWPGVGLLLYNAILARDYPLIQGILLFSVVAVILASFVVDFVYGLVDPRVRWNA